MKNTMVKQTEQPAPSSNHQQPAASAQIRTPLGAPKLGICLLTSAAAGGLESWRIKGWARGVAMPVGGGFLAHRHSRLRGFVDATQRRG